MRVIIAILIALISIIVCVVLLILLYNHKALNLEIKNSPLVRQTANGMLKGIDLTTILGQKYYAFNGIPFAAAPITGVDPYTGEKVDRRFKVCFKLHIFINLIMNKIRLIFLKAPEPFTYNWTGVFKADKTKALCQSISTLPPQYSKHRYSEDCLFLNIFVPGTSFA